MLRENLYYNHRYYREKAFHAREKTPQWLMKSHTSKSRPVQLSSLEAKPCQTTAWMPYGTACCALPTLAWSHSFGRIEATFQYWPTLAGSINVTITGRFSLSEPSQNIPIHRRPAPLHIQSILHQLPLPLNAPFTPLHTSASLWSKTNIAQVGDIVVPTACRASDTAQRYWYSMIRRSHPSH